MDVTLTLRLDCNNLIEMRKNATIPLTAALRRSGKRIPKVDEFNDICIKLIIINGRSSIRLIKNPKKPESDIVNQVERKI